MYQTGAGPVGTISWPDCWSPNLKKREIIMLRGGLLWILGIPLPIVILLLLFGII